MTTYIQIAHKLRLQRPGQPDRLSVRPRRGSRERGWEYLDDDAPTLVEIGPEDGVDIELLLRAGGIRPYAPREKEGDDGEARG